MQLDVFTLVPHAFAWLTEQRPVAAVLGDELDLRLFSYRDYTPLRAGQVDDEPYGGGAGMVLRVDVVVTGHTHMQQDRTVAGIRWVNAGSVGLPYEDDIQAFWALLGPDVDLRRTPFDASAAIAAFEAVGREDAARFAENFRSAPSRREAAEYFESLV